MGSKSKKERRRSRSSSREHKKKRKRSESTDELSDSSGDFQKKLQDHRKGKREQKKVDKERRKEMETPEEKRARRLAKKLKKQEKHKQQVDDGYLPPSVPYTNLNNPFNDPKLSETFVWKKKLDTEGRGDIKRKDLERETKDRVRKNLYEMEELKRNRDARLAAREDYDMIKRDQEKAMYGDWDKTEADFQLQQAKVRSQLRIEQNRAKPIDLLIRYIDYKDEPTETDNTGDKEFELEDPFKYIRNLTIEDYEDLFEDIKVCKKIDGAKNADFWEDISTVANDELRRAKTSKKDASTQAVQGDIEKVYKGKSLDALYSLKRDIEKKVNQRGTTMIISYWEELLRQLTVHISRLRLRDLHKRMLELKLRRIKEMMKDEDEEEMPEIKPYSKTVHEERERSRSRSLSPSTSTHEKWNRPKVNLASLEDPELDEQEKDTKWKQLLPDELEEATIELYERGGYSPTYGDPDDAMPGIEILNENDDKEKLISRRESKRKKPEGMSESEAEMMAMARKGMDKDEGTFSVEVPIEAQKHLWSDKYRPRKPRYLNRVQTGFEWNKYNQTHYDMDNPPPKVVQGYKFNVFYPDLLDITQTPSFKIFLDPNDNDFATIRFHAGPPYEDIAFKIVNREWDLLHKNGYKCQFQQGVFQLWFMFKKYRYRR